MRPAGVRLSAVLSAAGILHDVTEIVDEGDSSPAAAEQQVMVAQQRAVLRVAAEVLRARQFIAKCPQAPVAGAAVECAVEGIEGGRLPGVGGRDQRASGSGGAVAGAGLDSRQVGLEPRLLVVDVIVPPGLRAAE